MKQRPKERCRSGDDRHVTCIRRHQRQPTTGVAGDAIQHDVERRNTLEGVRTRVVEHFVGTELAHLRDVATAAYAHHPGACGLRNLHADVTDAARGADNEHTLARAAVQRQPCTIAQSLQRRHACERHGRSHVVRHAVGHRDEFRCARNGVVRTCAAVHVSDSRVHAHADGETRDAGADRRNIARDVVTGHCREAHRHDQSQRSTGALPVHRIHTGAAHAHQHLAWARCRLGRIDKVQTIGSAVLLQLHRTHRMLLTSVRRWNPHARLDARCQIGRAGQKVAMLIGTPRQIAHLAPLSQNSKLEIQFFMVTDDTSASDAAARRRGSLHTARAFLHRSRKERRYVVRVHSNRREETRSEFGTDPPHQIT